MELWPNNYVKNAQPNLENFTVKTANCTHVLS